MPSGKKTSSNRTSKLLLKSELMQKRTEGDYNVGLNCADDLVLGNQAIGILDNGLAQQIGAFQPQRDVPTLGPQMVEAFKLENMPAPSGSGARD